jgi:hypothetical protein
MDSDFSMRATAKTNPELWGFWPSVRYLSLSLNSREHHYNLSSVSLLMVCITVKHAVVFSENNQVSNAKFYQEQ